MRKKLTFSFVLLAILVGGGYFLSLKMQPPIYKSGYCPFDDPKILARQSFYEDELVIALCDYKPIVPGHCLVIPKRHVERFEMLTDAEILRIGQVIKKVNLAVSKVFDTSAYLLMQKNGYEVGQTVPHVHFHYLPRKKGDSSTIGFIFDMYAAMIKSPMSAAETQKIVENLKKAIQSQE